MNNNKNAVSWLTRNCEDIYKFDETFMTCKYHGHNIRYAKNVLEVGNLDFDRWANSSAYEVEMRQENISVQVNLAIIEARKDTSGYFERSMAVMINLSKG